jgi:hypothetical protein
MADTDELRGEPTMLAERIEPWLGTPFFEGAVARLIEAGVTHDEARVVAGDVIRNWIDDEKTYFADPAYGWEAADGSDLMVACEIEYWDEVAP